ncbi:MAG: Hint domain-containing protein [Pseudomonadota bacterium]
MTIPQKPQSQMPNRPLMQQQWTARRTSVQPQVNFPMRRFEAMALMPNGQLAEIVKRAPAHPLFEGAFCALARGSIIATEEGPTAVEDLVPGMRIETREHGFQTLTWHSTITLVPNQQPGQTPPRLFRLPVDSFGPSRPMPDLMLAPHARLLHRSERLRPLVQGDAALTPITAFEDGHSVIRVAPLSPVSVYHLGFQDHQILRANGIDIESFHPGTDLSNRIAGDGLRLFMSFFPHLQSVADFGPLCTPRLSTEEFAAIQAA